MRHLAGGTVLAATAALAAPAARAHASTARAMLRDSTRPWRRQPWCPHLDCIPPPRTRQPGMATRRSRPGRPSRCTSWWPGWPQAAGGQVLRQAVTRARSLINRIPRRTSRLHM